MTGVPPALGFLACLLAFGLASSAAATGSPPATGNESHRLAKVRKDHPRMFFTKETFPLVKAYAVGEEKDYYQKIRRRVTAMPRTPNAKAVESGSQPRYGSCAQMAAFVWWVERDPNALAKARAYLLEGAEFYNRRSSARQTVNWYSAGRFATDRGEATVLFNTTGPVGGRITIPGKGEIGKALATKVFPQAGIGASSE